MEIDISLYIEKITGEYNSHFNDYLYLDKFKEYLAAAKFFREVVEKFDVVLNDKEFSNFLIFALWLKLIDEEIDYNKTNGKKYLNIIKKGQADKSKPNDLISYALY